MLSRGHTPRSVHRIAKTQWGLRTIRRKSQGGALVHLSSVNAILRNTFYAGVFKWDGQMVAGRHEPMLSLQEFERVQSVFRRSDQRKPQLKSFPYTGFLRCGACGLSITAEDKRNKYGSLYTYYHCTRSRHEMPCAERYIRKELLEEQIVAFLDSLRIAPHVCDWLNEILDEQPTVRASEREAQRASAEASVRTLDRELETLTDLRVRSLLSDDEFTRKRVELTGARLSVRQQVSQLKEDSDWIEPLRTLISFSNKAVEYFSGGDDAQKRLVLITTSSNSTLSDRILSIEAKKPFVQWSPNTTKSEIRRFICDVRTFVESNDKDFSDIIANIRNIMAASEDGRRAA